MAAMFSRCHDRECIFSLCEFVKSPTRDDHVLNCVGIVNDAFAGMVLRFVHLFLDHTSNSFNLSYSHPVSTMSVLPENESDEIIVNLFVTI